MNSIITISRGPVPDRIEASNTSAALGSATTQSLGVRSTLLWSARGRSIMAALIISLFLTLSRNTSAEDITVRLINARSGRPLSSVFVAMSHWNGTFDIHKPPYPKREIVQAITDAKGKVVFHLSQPTPEHVGFSVGNPRDFAGCWHLRDTSPEFILRSGAVSDYNESKCGKLKVLVPATPGEVVIFERKLTLAEKMHQEIP
jgi:hypothetical protein